MDGFTVHGVFQAGVLVTDIDECLRLFRDALGLRSSSKQEIRFNRLRASPESTIRL